ncbi:MAG: hypothetical protein RMJ44_12185 [Cytophagales bacterium]|nr:hypothetical protein [Bernardetiaceae bacterium]MDW8211832.1 hypothetical protein [Cytophagales bacterium]
MTTLLLTVGFAIGVMALFFVLMSVRLLLLKNGEFKGTCATQSPALRQSDLECLVCGKKVGQCQNEANAVASSK